MNFERVRIIFLSVLLLIVTSLVAITANDKFNELSFGVIEGQGKNVLFEGHTQDGGNEAHYPPLKVGERIWLMINQSEYAVDYQDCAECNIDSRTGSIKIKLISDLVVPSGYGVISPTQFPKQTWREIYYGDEGTAPIREIMKDDADYWKVYDTISHGHFILFQKEESANIFHTWIFNSQNGNVKLIGKITNNEHPLILLGDIDGDGIPEFVGKIGANMVVVKVKGLKLYDLITAHEIK